MKKKAIVPQSIVSAYIDRFIAYKRALGCRYDVEEATLRLLERYLIKANIPQLRDVTPEHIEQFLSSRIRPHPRSYNHLLCTVRRFFDWLISQEVLETSPVKVKPKRQHYERTPFIFDLKTAKRLLETALALPETPNALIRGATYHAMFALLYGLGLRVGEVCRLQFNDVDFDRKLLVIQKTKFGKSRLVPFGPKVEKLLKKYRQIRIERIGKTSMSSPFFSFCRDKAINPCTVSQTFHHLLPQLSLKIPMGCSPPTLHTLRHSFAVRRLIRWYQEGIDPGTDAARQGGQRPRRVVPDRWRFFLSARRDVKKIFSHRRVNEGVRQPSSRGLTTDAGRVGAKMLVAT